MHSPTISHLLYQIDEPSVLVSSTTHSWTLKFSSNRFVTVSCKGKIEHRLVRQEFDSLRIFDSHPALDRYFVPHTTLYIDSAATSPGSLLQSFERIIGAVSSNLRTAGEYMNSYHPELILTQGHGAIFSGPDTYAAEIEHLLSKDGVAVTVMRTAGSVQHDGKLNLMQLGQGFVIARQFTWEP